MDASQDRAGQKPAGRIRVLIADDKPQVRQELSLVLQLTGELEVVGEAANGLEAISQAEALRPDAVVMDLEMPVLDGFAATRQIKERGLAGNVVILSVHADSDNLQRARQAGADVFIDKASRFTTLMSAIVVSRQSI
jgi:DNA-binding NarL/FixJ family response regulator